jgi:BirA family biotin operon repressor/biotin-[acetyl-CoA-carboxylase] ligase
LTVISATALRRAIRTVTGLTAEIKWPNDLLLGGRKTAGILTDMSAELDRVRHVILGIGVDVNQGAGGFPPDLRPLATSLKLECGAHLSRAELAVEILRELDADYARVGAGAFAQIANEWEAACVTIGRNVTVHAGERRFRGRAESLDDDGALLIRTEHGHLERVIGGDVTLEK